MHVRRVLPLVIAALVIAAVAGDVPAVAREFLATFSNEKFVVPICSAMGFAYVLKHTGCERHLVLLLVRRQELHEAAKRSWLPGFALLALALAAILLTTGLSVTGPASASARRGAADERATSPATSRSL